MIWKWWQHTHNGATILKSNIITWWYESILEQNKLINAFLGYIVSCLTSDGVSLPNDQMTTHQRDVLPLNRNNKSVSLSPQTVLQCYSEMVEFALRQRLRAGLQEGPMGKEEEEEEEDQRAGTPTDMRDIDFWTTWAIPSVINEKETVVLVISETDVNDCDCENVPHFFWYSEIILLFYY